MPAKPDRGDPWNAHYFSLEIDGEEIAHFLEASGFKSQSTVFEIQEGGANGDTHSRPGQSKWNTITLKQAVNASRKFMEWRDGYVTDEGFGKRKTTSGAIVIRDNDGSELRRFSMTGLWPVSWEGPSMSSGGSDLAVETLEVAFDGVYVGGAPAPTPEPEPEPTPDEFKTEPIQFKFDSAELTPKGKETCGELADQLEKHPEVQTLYVEGHTCDLGTHSYNQSLSSARAQSVANEMKKQKPNVTYIPNGYSYDYPVAPNNSEGNRARNRRTQFFTSPRAGKRPGELDYKSYKK
jgi:phage tail-like protein